MSETPKWIAVDEVGNDNFATSIYENDYKGLLVARCNQNGQYPWQAPAIIGGLEANKSLPNSAALAAAYQQGREDAAKIAEIMARGQALEINGETMLLGSMQMRPGPAQKATALAIAAAIRSAP